MTAPLKRHDYYLGPVGRLTAVRDPAPGYRPNPDIAVTVHKLLSGKVLTDRPAFTPRVYSMSFQAVPDSELAWLEQCSLGYVPGPLYWVDPLVRNQLPPSVSAPTVSTVISEQFTALNGGITFREDGSQGFGGVDWTPGGVSELYVTPRVPVVPGLLFTASAGITRYSGIELFGSMNIDWYDAAGVFLSRKVGSGVTLTTLGGAYRLEAGASPPAGAVQGRLALYVPGARSFRVDSWQVEYGPLSAFQPGPGLAKVAILSYEPDVYLSGMTDVIMSMSEVR